MFMILVIKDLKAEGNNSQKLFGNDNPLRIEIGCGKGDYTALTTVDALASDVEFYAIGFKKGSALTEKVNEQLDKLGKDGTIKTLAEKYGVATTAITDFADQK